MNKIIYILSFILICMTSCTKNAQLDTAILSERTLCIIDYFIDETTEWHTNENVLEVETCMDKSGKYLYLNIVAHDSAFYKPYGKLNGIMHYKGYYIMLFGDSWNKYFWSYDTICDIPNKNADIWKDDFVIYDPVEWNICVQLNDTTINKLESRFPIPNSVPEKEYVAILCDSIERILKN